MRSSLKQVIQCVISVASRFTTGWSVPSSHRELPQYLIRVLVRILEVHLAVALVLVGQGTIQQGRG